ncbi:MAG TPA: dienelactone hydrolase family protein [Bryobacteraceae bacterium]|jgi:dienelactone hydrolase
MRVFFLTILLAATAAGQPAEKMVEGITRYLLRATGESAAHRSPSRDKLRKILGAVDARVSFTELQLMADSAHPALLFEGDGYQVYAVRWPVLDGISAEGLWFKPRGRAVARVVSIPDSMQLPEQFQASQTLARAGCEVLSPVLINREDTWSGVPRFRMTNQPHREFIYRMAFEVGRHVLGYEVQKVLAAVDWFAAQPAKVPIGVWGYGDGGALALYAAALDDRIAAAGISGYFGPREDLWKQPIDRNVFGLLRDFGDAELAGMVAPRRLVIDTTPGPVWDGPSTRDRSRQGAAPGVLAAIPEVELEKEFTRAQSFFRGPGLLLAKDGLESFLRALGPTRPLPKVPVAITCPDKDARQHRQFEEMIQFTQQLARDSHFLREAGKLQEQRIKLRDDVIGRLPASNMPLNARQTRAYDDPAWTGYDVTYDVLPDVFGYGVLLVPKDIRPGERRPVIVAQHGLQGRPQDMFAQPENDKITGFHFYQNVGSKLAAKGYVVYMPQNPYTGDFRKIQRLANPLGYSIFSFIIAQHDRLLDWLSMLPYVDPSRIGFYGLSYGGKTALRVPAVLDRYAFSICSGDFNEWIHKVTTIEDANSYMFSPEFDMLEFDLAGVANHAEMAMMIAPRPFMVERGHRDGVGLDEWVAFEYARVKRFYDEQGIGDRTRIEFFNGPHMIHGVGTFEFIQKYFGR